MIGAYSIVKHDGSVMGLGDFSMRLGRQMAVYLPPQKHLVQESASKDGAVWQGSLTGAREITLHLAPKVRLPQWDALRAGLVAALNPALVSPSTPAYLRYTDDNKVVQVPVVLRDLETDDDGFVLTLVSYDPIWTSVTPTDSTSLAVSSTLSSSGPLYRRSAAGEWTGLGSIGGAVYDLLEAADGTLYAVGAFTGDADYVAQWDADSEAWVAVGAFSSPGGSYVRTITEGIDGKLYIGGYMTARVQVYHSGSWVELAPNDGAGTEVYALAMGNDGTLYVGGSMTGTLTGGGAVSSNVCAYDGTTWSELAGIAAGASSKVRCLAIGADGRVYAGGDFNSGGTGYVAVYTAGSGWDYLGNGLDGEVAALLWTSKGTLIAAGDFTGGVAEWNGMNWTVLGTLGVGTIGGSLGIATLAEGPDGTLYAGGHLGEADGLTLPDRMAQWNGSMWFPLDGNFPDSDVGVLTVNADGVVTFGGSGTGTATVAGVTTVTNNGAADAFPCITVAGPGTLYNITNWTTGESLYFDLTLIDGETLTIDLTPGVKAIVSDWRGNLLRTLLPGSRLASWHLAPGENVVGVFGGGEASMVWWERWWGV